MKIKKKKTKLVFAVGRKHGSQYHFYCLNTVELGKTAGGLYNQAPVGTGGKDSLNTTTEHLKQI